MGYFFRNQMSFKNQLSMVFIISIFMLSIITALTAAWTTNYHVREILIKDGLEITQDVANHSVLALLYSSPENANDAVHSALAFHSIQYVAILDKYLHPLISSTTPPVDLPTAKEILSARTKAILSRDTKNSWHFIAPVFLPTNTAEKIESSNRLKSNSSAPLGYAHIIMDKSVLKSIRNATLINHIGVALIVAIMLIIAMHFILKHFLRPLSELATTMERAKYAMGTMYTGAKGPKETTIIANTFNAMIKTIMERDNKLRQHNNTLESEVALRTHELVHARDAALEASRHKSEFLSNVSHELRTPLQSIIGYTDILLETIEDEGLFEYADDLKRIAQNANHLLNLINTILDLTKIEAGRMQLAIEEADLKKILQQVTDIVQPLMAANNNKLTTSIAETDELLQVDAGKLLQIILNIVGNAAKFTQNGKVSIQAQYTAKKLEIIITDNGIGISSEQLTHIFEPFRQVDGSTTRKFQGTGLGLSISRHFCELMGGEITVKSVFHKGTTFTIVIPLPIRESNS